MTSQIIQIQSQKKNIVKKNNNQELKKINIKEEKIAKIVDIKSKEIIIKSKENKKNDGIFSNNSKNKKKKSACDELNQIRVGTNDIKTTQLRSMVSGVAVFNNGCRIKTGMKLGNTRILEIDAQTLTIKTDKGNIFFENY